MDDELKNKVRQQVLANFDYSDDITDEELKDEIDRCLMEVSRSTFCPLAEREELKHSIFSSIRGLDILDELLRKEDITEIMVNGENHIFYESQGCLYQWEKRFSSREKLNDIIQQIAAVSNRVVNESEPIADARLPDGSRVNIVLPPVALDGPTVTIRKFSKQPLTMEKLISYGAISEEAAKSLKLFVETKYSIFICGGTGSGKTTFLNALSGYIPKTERIITIEDSAELKIEGVTNLVRLETRNKNSEGCKAISIRDLIKSALRMRPDRIIVGEIRGPEAIDMLQAMNTGHDGSLSTGHANSSKDMLERMATMVIMGIDIPMPAVKQQISSAIDIIVHLDRMRDGSRKVTEISEVVGVVDGEIKLNLLYEFREDAMSTRDKISGQLTRTDNRLQNTDKLVKMGRKWEE